jgi:hypothetical protein
MGFTPLPKEAKIVLEGPGEGYDAMLHVYGKTYRTIAFRKSNDGYKWIGEQEVYTGPRRYRDANNIIHNERLSIEYQIEPVDGIPVNRTYVHYFGDDPRLARSSELTLLYVAPILAEWKSLQR